MKHYSIEKDGITDYFISVGDACKELEMSKHTFYSYLKKVKFNPVEDKKRIGMEVYYSGELLARICLKSKWLNKINKGA
jgi:hypothetical protein